MSAPEGNQYWRLRAKSGAPRKYEDAESLWKDCDEYFEARSAIHMNRQPLPFTLASLCLFLDITLETWHEWRRSRDDLSDVITRVDSIIRDQKLTGAMVGAYNHNIVARDLGLADKSEVEGRVQVTKVVREIVSPDNTDS